MIFAKKECCLTKKTMKKNIGDADGAIRILVALFMVGLFYTKIITGTVGIGLLILAGVFVLTSFVSFCPLYLPFGISTRKKDQ